jgi:O-antigen/teichoic acid export membrane protein
VRFPVIPARFQGWVRNVGSSYADAAVGGVIFIFLTPVIVQRLGAEAYAAWVLAHTIAFYLAFLDLGFANAQVRYHARYTAQGKAQAVRDVIATSCVSLVAAGTVAALLGCAVALIHPDQWLEVSASLAEDFRVALVLLAINMLVSFLGAAVENIYEGEQRFDLRNIRSIIIRIITAAAQLVVLYRGGGVVELVAVELGASCLKVLVDLVFTSRIVPGWWRAKAAFHKSVWRRLRSFALWTSADEVLTEGSSHLDDFLIAALFPLVLLTPYSICTSVAGVMLMAVHPVVETFFPLASGLHAQQRGEDLARLMVVGSKVATAIAAPLGIVLVFFGNPLIEWWVPEAAEHMPEGLMAAVVLDYFTSMYLWTATVILVAINRTRLVVILTLVEIVLGVVLMIALAPHFGLVGIAVASFIANALMGFFVQMPLAARAARVSLSEVFGTAIGRVALACVPAIAVAALLHEFFVAMSLPALLGSVLAVLAVYGVGLFFVGIRRDERDLYMTLWRNASGGS